VEKIKEMANLLVPIEWKFLVVTEKADK